MGAFNLSPGGCCCSIVSGWFDIWYQWEYDPSLIATPVDDPIGHMFLGGGMRTWDTEHATTWSPGVQDWWNTYDRENFFLVPQEPISAIDGIRDFGSDIYTLEKGLNNVRYVTRYELNAGENGRIDRSELTFGRPPYPEGSGAGLASPGIQYPTYANMSMQYWLASSMGAGMPDAIAGFAWRWWRQPEGLFLFSIPTHTVVAGRGNYALFQGGTVTLTPLTGYVPVAFFTLFRPPVTMLGLVWNPNGITAEDPTRQLSMLDGKYVATDYTFAMTRLYAAPDYQSGIIYLPDGTQLRLAAQVNVIETQRVNLISANHFCGAQKANSVEGAYMLGFDTGVHEQAMYLEFHVGKGRVVLDDSAECYYLDSIIETSEDNTLIKRVECIAHWGFDGATNANFGFDIPAMQGEWYYLHGKGYTSAGILWYFDRTGGFGESVGDGKYHLELYINKHLVREIILPSTYHVGPGIYEPIYHPWLGAPYVRRDEGGDEEVVIIHGRYSQPPTEANPNGVLEVDPRDGELVIYGSGGGPKFRSPPIPLGHSRIIGASERWFYLLIDAPHTGEEMTGGKFCLSRPGNVSPSCMWLVNGTEMVPYGMIHQQKEDGKYVVDPRVSQIGNGFPKQPGGWDVGGILGATTKPWVIPPSWEAMWQVAQLA